MDNIIASVNVTRASWLVTYHGRFFHHNDVTLQENGPEMASGNVLRKQNVDWNPYPFWCAWAIHQEKHF